MKFRQKSAVVAIATAVAASMAGAGGAGADSADAGTGVLGGAPPSLTRSSVYAVDESEFRRLDVDQDGRLSRDEAKALSALQRDWATVDHDGDTRLSRDELARYHAEGKSVATASLSSGHVTSHTPGLDNAAGGGSEPRHDNGN